MEKMKIGLIGIVREASKQDFWGTMAKVAEIGYQGIESPAPLLEGDVSENLKRFHGLGLRVLTYGASREALTDELDKVIANAKALQSPRVTCWWSPCETKEAVLKDAELFTKAGERLAAEGLCFCYHNHDQEFRNVFEGKPAMDLFAENTDPAKVSFNIDIGWVAVGGADPSAVLRKLKGRVPAIHIKDFADLSDRASFTTVGTGAVDIVGTLRTAIELGIEWGVVEQDRLRNLDEMQTVTASYLNLKESGLVE